MGFNENISVGANGGHPSTAPHRSGPLPLNLQQQLGDKYNRLRRMLTDLGQVLVAFSGGVDSALLAAVAHDTLGDNAMAVVARSPSLPRREFRIAGEVAEKIGIRLVTVDTFELDNPEYAANTGNRCFFCKDELFVAIARVVEQTGIRAVAYGENADDVGDYRPGSVAAKEHGVHAPLRDAGFTKDDVRQLARHFDLPVWDKPAFACLASRFPVGTKINRETLERVEKAEDVVWDAGFREFRVRHHGDLARIEVPHSHFQDLLDAADTIVQGIREAGYMYVTLDLGGFRSAGLKAHLPLTTVESSPDQSSSS